MKNHLICSNARNTVMYGASGNLIVTSWLLGMFVLFQIFSFSVCLKHLPLTGLKNILEVNMISLWYMLDSKVK